MDLRDLRELFIDSLKYIVLIIALIYTLTNVITIQQVIGPSMNPTYQNGDALILGRFHYKIFKIKRYDVISFSDKQSKYLIKRVIGLPGEKIEYIDNKLYINDIEVDDKYSVDTYNFSVELLGYDKIPEGYYLVLGDNRKDSLDSRQLGLIKKENIIGKPYFRLWPLFR